MSSPTKPSIPIGLEHPLEAVLRGHDVYKLLAAARFDVKPSEVTKEQRNFIKQENYRNMYGGPQVDESIHLRRPQSHPTEDLYIVHSREKFKYNTDPQRRCYNGAHYSSEWRWGAWIALCMRGLTLEEANESVERWRSIGRPTCEFKAVKVGEEP